MAELIAQEESVLRPGGGQQAIDADIVTPDLFIEYFFMRGSHRFEEILQAFLRQLGLAVAAGIGRLEAGAGHKGLADHAAVAGTHAVEEQLYRGFYCRHFLVRLAG